MARRDTIQAVAFLLAIIIVYLPMIQLSLSTFIPNPEEPTCDERYRWENVPKPVEGEEIIDEVAAAECKAAWDAYEEGQDQANKVRFITGTILSLITIAVVFFTVMPTELAYGLFGSAVLNVLFNLRFADDKNVVGVFTLIMLFIVVVAYIVKKRR